MELLCPAGNLQALKSAVDHGADAVYIGFRDGTNAREFPGLNFTDARAREGIAYAHERGAKVLVALNTYVQAGGWSRWQAAVDRSAEFGVDAIILGDPGLLEYAAERWPDLDRHLSVQASATTPEALAFYQKNFGIARAVLPRVLSIRQVEAIAAESVVDLEVFGFGSLCVMAEGRCMLSSYTTGQSPNTVGVCSPAWAVRWDEAPEGREARLGGVLIDRFAPDEFAGYPTLCKGRFDVEGQTEHAFENPTSLDTLELIPRLHAAGVKAIKIEGRQRSPAYIASVAAVWRRALDAFERNGTFTPSAEDSAALESVSEGARTTLGAYERTWQ